MQHRAPSGLSTCAHEVASSWCQPLGAQSGPKSTCYIKWPPPSFSLLPILSLEKLEVYGGGGPRRDWIRTPHIKFSRPRYVELRGRTPNKSCGHQINHDTVFSSEPDWVSLSKSDRMSRRVGKGDLAQQYWRQWSEGRKVSCFVLQEVRSGQTRAMWRWCSSFSHGTTELAILIFLGSRLLVLGNMMSACYQQYEG